MFPAIVIPSLVKKLFPSILTGVLNHFIKTFPGIEKIPYLVKYMEDENETDIALKQLADEFDARNIKQDQINNNLKAELEKWKKNV